ncbi:hypothetical protein FA95DRAFT_1504356, partial [Auriscalpium vulgare]
RRSESILDRQGRVLAQLVAPPRKDASWRGVPAGASAELRDAAAICPFSPDQLRHARGRYPALSAGYSWGGGPTRPKNASFYNDDQAAVAEGLLNSRNVGRILGHGSSAFATFNNECFEHYAAVLQDIRTRQPELRPPSANSVFPSVTFNFGPQAVTVPHRDAKNVPYGWCAVTALGDFDHERGGHLVLWDLQLVIEFPAGSTILIPSALITHSNASIQPGETRQSITQFCAGALIRWHAYGFRTEAAMRRQDRDLGRAFDDAATTRWGEMLSYLPTWEGVDVGGGAADGGPEPLETPGAGPSKQPRWEPGAGPSKHTQE